MIERVVNELVYGSTRTSFPRCVDVTAGQFLAVENIRGKLLYGDVHRLTRTYQESVGESLRHAS